MKLSKTMLDPPYGFVGKSSCGSIQRKSPAGVFIQNNNNNTHTLKTEKKKFRICILSNLKKTNFVCVCVSLNIHDL